MPARYEEHIWPANPGAPSQKARKGYLYRTYIPAPIAGLSVSLPGHVAAAVSEADHAVAVLNEHPPMTSNLEILAHRLLRAEALGSSRVEGFDLSGRRLARAAYAPEAVYDESAKMVLGNIAAMEQAIQFGRTSRRLSVDDLCSLHMTLLANTRDHNIAGNLRHMQNWIGGSAYGPHNAAFIPPPASHVPGLMNDLAQFMGRDDLSATVQAAIAHAQFETIHPFIDGNGRVGRCLIHILLGRRQSNFSYVPPISLIFATDVNEYVRGLTAYHNEHVTEWIEHFADTTTAAAKRAGEFAQRIELLKDDWNIRADQPRQNSAASKLIELLPTSPIVDVSTAAKLAGVSVEAARNALSQLEAVGILKQTSFGRRNRVWEAFELYKILDSFERELAIPSNSVHPNRGAPASRRGETL